MRILATFTPHLEIYSIEEAFLNLEGFTDLEQYLCVLRRGSAVRTGAVSARRSLFLAIWPWTSALGGA